MKNKQKRPDAQILSALCEQLLLMLGAGIPLHENIEALKAGQDESAHLFEALEEPLRRGETLSGAMAESGCFPSEMVSMIRNGEEAGQLERVLEGLAAHYARIHQLSRAVADAVRYPLTLLLIMSLVVLVLVFQVTPIFEKALHSLGTDVDSFSQQTMFMAQTAGWIVFALCALLMIGAVVIWQVTKNEKYAALRKKMLRCVKPLAQLERLSTAQKAASTLSVLLSSGMPMESAIELSAEVVSGEAEKEALLQCIPRLEEGMEFAAALGKTGLFDPLYIRMIHAGAAAGQTDTALSKTAQMLAQEIDDRLSHMVSIIEPAMMIVLGTMIGAILLAVLAPVSGVLSAIV